MTAAREPPDSTGQGIDWAAAIATHRTWLRTVVYSRVGDVGAVDEIMQNIGMAIFDQNRAVNSTVRNVQGWLYRVAVRQSLLYLRTAGRRKRHADEFAANSESNGHVPNPLDLLLVDEERGLMRAALNELRPRDRELLLLKYTEGWTARELAERLEIPVATVESRLERARERLRRELARMGLQGES